jgi:hypothetical protein
METGTIYRIPGDSPEEGVGVVNVETARQSVRDVVRYVDADEQRGEDSAKIPVKDMRNIIEYVRKLEADASAFVPPAAGSLADLMRPHTMRPGTREAMLDFFDEGYSYLTITSPEFGVMHVKWEAKYLGDTVGQGMALSTVEAVNQVLKAFKAHKEKTDKARDILAGTDFFEREIITTRGGEGSYITGKRRVYKHHFSVQKCLLTSGYMWVVRDKDKKFVTSGNAELFSSAANAARNAVKDLVDREEVKLYV